MTTVLTRTSTPRRTSDSRAASRSALGKGAEQVRRALEQQDSRRLGPDVPKVLAQRLASNLGERACKFHPRRPTADDDEGQQPELFVGRRLPFRRLERQQHAPPDLQRVVERLQAGRALGPFAVAEVRMRRAGGDDQVVVGMMRPAFSPTLRRPPLLSHPTPQLQPLRRRDVRPRRRRDVREQHRDVLLPAQHPADRRRDVAGRQRGRGDLVEERLEQMVVVAIEQA